MKRSSMGAWLAALIVAQPLFVSAQEAGPGAATAATVDAVWVEREVTFTYMPLTSYYSCDGLRDKVRWILKELGARPGFKVSSRGCMEAQGPEVFPGVKIVAAFPVEATPEVLAGLASDASKRQLAARATGQLEAAAEATAQFPARARRVEFRSSGSINELRDGDCELMEQLRKRAFGPLGIKVVEDDLHCVPRQVSIGAVRMTVEVLEAVPAA